MARTAPSGSPGDGGGGEPRTRWALAHAECQLYVPLSAVNRSDASGIYLALTQADLQRDEWLTPPTVR